ncbi:MAG: hypothetical protein ACRC5C_07600 [Bacilli bacterium]
MRIIFKLFLVVGMFCVGSFPNHSRAAQPSEQETASVLHKFGFEPSTISAMDDKQKETVSTAIVEDPTNVQLATSYVVVNNLEIFAYYTNTSDEQLLQNKVSEKEIKKIRHVLKILASLTEKEFKDQFSVSSAEYQMIKLSLTKNPNYHHRDNGNHEVTTSGTLDRNWMSYAMYITNKSTKQAPSYDVTITYNWQKAYFTDLFTDKIAIVWGGELISKNMTSIAKYYRGNFLSGFTTQLVDKKPWVVERRLNNGILFSTEQSISLKNKRRTVPALHKLGTVKATLYQSKFEGLSTNVISKFAHQEFGADSHIILSNGIDLGSSYSATEELYRNIMH